MSKTVDERVVEMRFDNAQFERNVQTSMSTLDKLKQSLKFSDASKGFDSLGKAANKVRFDGMIDGIDTVNARFSYVQGAIQHQINNIVDTCVNAGRRMVSALTINPVKDGFAEYETQMNAVQTILANTQKEGTNVKIVNKALDELNTYADKTIYNFTEMTRNIGTFTAAGVKLDTSVSAIKGIANLAAVSGSTSQQASTAMYQLSQAIASGTVKLMDWNSVVNAGMGGQVFQDALIRTSEHLQTGAKAAISAEGSFRESLTTGWLTTEVLTETLDMFSTAADTQEEYEAAVQKFISKGYTQEEAKQMADMAKTAGEAATKVKTFTQLIDTLKEALGSGWTTTWRLIIGDFEEAKAVWTSVSDVLSGFINKMSDARNKLLESALGKGFSELSDKMKDILGVVSDITDPVKDVVDSMENVGSTLTDLGAIVDDVILGKFGNGQERFDALTRSGYNWCEVQNKVNEKLGCSFRYTQDQIDAQNKLIGTQEQTAKTADQAADATSGLTDEQKAQLKELVKLSDEQLRAKGLTDDQIAALKELKDTAKKLGIPIDKFIDQLDQINGRWLLIEGFKNIGRAIAKVFSSMAKAAKEVFNAIKPETIFNALAAFHKFTAALILSDENADKLKRTFKGLFAALDIIKTILGGTVSVAFKIFTRAIGNANINILDFTARIGDAIVKFRDFLLDNKYINGAVDFLVEGFEKVAEVIGQIIDALLHNPVTDKIASVWDKLFGEADGKNASGLITALKELGDQMDISDDKAHNFKSVFEGIFAGLEASNWWFIGSLTNGLKVLNAVLQLFGTDLVGVGAKLADYIIKFRDWVKEHTIFIGMINKIAAALHTFIIGIDNCVKAFMQLPQVQKIIQSFKDLLTKMFGDMSKGFDSVNIEGFCNKIKEAFDKIKSWIEGLKNSENLGRDIVYGIGNGIVAAAGAIKDALVSIANFIKDTFSSLFGDVSKRLDGLKLDGIADRIKSAIEKAKAAISNVTGFSDVGSNIVLGIATGILAFAGGGIVIKAITAIVNLIKNTFCGLLGIHSPSRWGIEQGKYIVEGIAEGIKAAINLISDAITFVVSKIMSVFGTGKVKISENFTKLFDSIKKIWSNFMELVNGIDFKKVLAIIPVAIVLLFAKKLWDLANTLAAGINGINGVLAGFAGVEKNFSKVLGAMAMDIKAKAVQKLAISLAILVASLIALTFVDTDKLITSTAVLIVLAGVLAGLAFAVGKLDAASVKFNKEKGLDISGLKTTLLQIGVVIALLAVSVKLMGSMNMDEMKQGFIGLAGCVGAVAVVLLAFGALAKMDATKNVDKAGSMILKVSVAMLLMVGVCKLAAKLKPEEMKKGAVFAAGFAVFVAAMAACYRLAGDNVNKLGAMMIKISFALGLMVGVVKLIGLLKPEEMKKGAAFIAAFTVFTLALKLISQLFPDAQMQKISGMMISLSFALILMVGVCKLVGKLSVSEMVKGAAFMAGFILLIGLLVQVTKIGSQQKMAKVAATILAMSIAITAMAGVCVLMSLLTPDMLQRGLLAVMTFGLMMSMMVSSARGVTDIKGTVMMMAVSIGIMAASVAALSFIKPDKLRNAVLALSMVMAMFALMESQASGIGKSAATVGVMAGTIALIGFVLYQLADLPAKGALAAAASLSAVMLAMGVTMGIIGKYGKMSNRAMASTAVMVLALYVISKAVGILMGMKGINDAIKAAAALSVMLAGLSVAMVILSKMSDSAIDTKGILKFVIAVTALTLAMTALAPALQAMGSIGWGSLAKAGVALAGLALGLNMMNDTVAGSLALFIAAGALKVLAPVLKTLGSMSLESIGKSILALAGALAVLGAAGAVISVCPLIAAGLLALSAAVLVFGVAALAFGGGVALLANGLQTISTVGPDAAQKLVDAIGTITIGILELIPQITAAMAQAIIAVCQAITEAAPQIAATVTSLIISVFEALVNSKAQLLESLATLLASVIDGLTEKLPELLTSLSNFIVTLINGLADHMSEFIAAGVNLVGSILQGITDNLGPIINEIIVPLLSVFGDILSQVFTAIGPYIPDIVDGMTLIAESVCDMVSRVTEAIAPFIPNIQMIVMYVVMAVQTVCGTIASIVGQIAPIIQAITGLVQQLGNSITQILYVIRDIIAQVGASISQILISLGMSFQMLGSAIRTALDGVADVVISVGESIKMALDGVANIISSVGESIKSVFEGIGDVITSVGDSIKSVLDGLANVFESIGNAALDAGAGFDRLANGVVKITDTKLSDMAGSLAAVAKGLGSIASHSDGLAAAGTGMKQITTGIQTSASSFTNMASNVKTVTTALQSIGPIASTAMATLNTSVSSTGSCFTTLSTTATIAMSNMMSIMAATVTTQSYLIVSAFNTMMNSVVTAITGKAAIFASAGQAMMSGLSMGIMMGASSVSLAVMTALSNVVTIVTSKQGIFTSAGTALMNGLGSGIMAGSSVVVSAVMSALATVSSIVTSRQGLFTSAGIALMSGLGTGMMSAAGTVIASINVAMSQATAIIIGRRGLFQAAGMQLMVGLRAGVTSGAAGMVSAVTMVVTKTYTMILARRAQFQVAGRQLIQMLANGLRSGASAVNSAISSAMSQCSSAIRSHYGSFKSAGGYLGDGLIAGINSKKQAAYNAGYALGQKAVQGEKDGQQSKSPSKLTKKAGRWLGEGLVIGMEQMGSAVYKTGKSMGANAVDSITGALSSINEVSTMDMGFEPTIRPVVDMNEIQNGSRSLSIGADLSANLLSKPVNSLQQIVSSAQADINASNDEVIKAINDLRADLATLYSGDDTEVALYMDSKKVASTLAKPMNRQLLTLQKRGAY